MTTTSLVGPRHLDADAAGDLVAHAGEAVFHVIAARRRRRPQLVQFARQAARGVDDHRVVAAEGARDRADHLGVRRQSRRWSGASACPAASSQIAFSRRARSATPASACQPPSAVRQPRQADLGVADERQRVVLGGVVGGDVERDDLEAAGLEQRPRAGGEVLQRVPTASTSRRRAASALAADVPVTPTAPRASGWVSSIDDLPACVSATGIAVRLGERPQLGRGLRIEHAAAGDDHRPLGRLERGDGRGELVVVRSGCGAASRSLSANEALRPVVGLGLNVLAHRERHRAAFGRIGEHAHRALQSAGSAARARLMRSK